MSSQAIRASRLYRTDQIDITTSHFLDPMYPTLAGQRRTKQDKRLVFPELAGNGTKVIPFLTWRKDAEERIPGAVRLQGHDRRRLTWFFGRQNRARKLG